MATFGGQAFQVSQHFQPLLVFGEGSAAQFHISYNLPDIPREEWPRFQIGGWAQGAAREWDSGFQVPRTRNLEPAVLLVEAGFVPTRSTDDHKGRPYESTPGGRGPEAPPTLKRLQIPRTKNQEPRAQATTSSPVAYMIARPTRNPTTL